MKDVRIYTCKFKTNPFSIHVVEKQSNIDQILPVKLMIEIEYFVENEQEFKQLTKLDITNAIHRLEIEKELKVAMESNLKEWMEKEEFTYSKIKEFHTDIESDSFKQLPIVQNGLLFNKISVLETLIDKKDVENIQSLLKVQEDLKGMKDIETEFKIFFSDNYDDVQPFKKIIAWVCPCGTVNKGNICAKCGHEKVMNKWICPCGRVNTTKYCRDCGTCRDQ